MADPIAVYGAVIGTIGAAGAGWNLYHSAFRDRADIRIRQSFGFPSRPIPGGPSSEFVQLTAANRGRRPVTVTGGGLLYGDGSTLWFSGEAEPLPKELREGESHFVWGYPADMIENIRKKGSIPTHAYYWDATSIMHKSRLSKVFRDWMGKEVNSK